MPLDITTQMGSYKFGRFYGKLIKKGGRAMGERQMDDMMKELLVSGLNDYNWSSLSTPQLFMLLRIIGSMEAVKVASIETIPVSSFQTADTGAGVH